MSDVCLTMIQISASDEIYEMKIYLENQIHGVIHS